MKALPTSTMVFCRWRRCRSSSKNILPDFIWHSLVKIWKNYTEDYYQMDRYYRQFHLCFQRSLETSNILLDDLFKHVVDQVEGLYSHWFLGELGNNWSDVCAEELAEYGKIMEIPHQEDFYRSRVKNADSRVFVIISDAMRYEVAATLAEELQRENQSQGEAPEYAEHFPVYHQVRDGCSASALQTFC